MATLIIGYMHHNLHIFPYNCVIDDELRSILLYILAEWRSGSVSALPCERPGFGPRTRLREIVPANNCPIPAGKHNNRQHASPHHEVATDVKQMPIRPIIIIIIIIVIIIIIIIIILLLSLSLSLSLSLLLLLLLLLLLSSLLSLLLLYIRQSNPSLKLIHLIYE